MPFNAQFHAKYIPNFLSIVIQLAMVLLITFAISFKILLAYCDVENGMNEYLKPVAHILRIWIREMINNMTSS